MAQSSVLEEIVVTARYKEEKLQETPLAISAFTGDNLESKNLTNLTDIDTFAPNTIIRPLGAGWGSTAAAFIRGIGLGDNSLSFEPGVPIYIDDVYHGRPQGALFDLLDLERVEVLRGPQGTLFGKNAIGGTVRMVSKKPQGDNTGFVEATYGKYDRIDVRGSFDVSVIPDTLFARASVSSKNRDGYFKILDYECVNGYGSLGPGGPGIAPGATHTTFGIPLPLNTPGLAGVPGKALGSVLGPNDTRAENGCVVDTLGGENVTSGRLALRWIVNDDLEVNLTGDYTKEDNEGPADNYTFFNPNHNFNRNTNNAVMEPIFGTAASFNDLKYLTQSHYTGYHRFGPDPLFGRDVKNVRELDHWGIAGVIEWQMMDSVHVKSITAYREFKNTFGRDSDGSPLPIDHTWDTSIHEQFTQEVQLTGIAFDDRLDWAAGFYYYDAQDSNQGWNFLYPYILSTNNHRDVQDLENWAIFFHGSFAVTDRINLSAGIRYTEDDKTANIFRQDFITGNVIIPHTEVTVTADELSPKVGLSYQWNDDVMVYAQWATGFRGGGFMPRPANPLQVAAFNVESAETYEVGIKSDWLDRRLRLNGAWFFTDYTDQQNPSQEFDASGAIWFATRNTGASEIWGIEIEMLAQPMEALQIEGSMGYINFDRVDPGNSGLCRTNPLTGEKCPSPTTPKWNAALGATYTWGLGNAGELSVRGDMVYQSRMFFNTDPNNGFQGEYVILNARATWVSPDDAWELSVFGTNLNDKVYYHGKLSLVNVLGREQGNVAAPAEWGISVKRRF